MAFKDKPLNKIVCDSRVTLDVIHQDKGRQFTEDKKEIQEKKDMLQKLQLDYKMNKIRITHHCNCIHILNHGCVIY